MNRHQPPDSRVHPVFLCAGTLAVLSWGGCHSVQGGPTRAPAAFSEREQGIRSARQPQGHNLSPVESQMGVVAPTSSSFAGPQPQVSAPTASPTQSDPPGPESLSPSSSASVQLKVEQPFAPGHPSRPPGRVNAAVADEEVGRWNLGGTGDPSFLSNQQRFHPGTRVIVDVELLHRGRQNPRLVRALKGALARARSQGYWPFRLCFEDARRISQQLPGGETRLRLVTSGSGQVLRSIVVKSDLKNREAQSCIEGESRRLNLSPLGRRRDIELSVSLWPGDTPLPFRENRETERGRAKAPTTTRESELTISQAQAIEAALAGSEQGLERCYRTALRTDSQLWGRLQLSVLSGDAGQVVQVMENESRFPDSSLVACVIDHVKSIPFPPGTRFETAFRFGSPNPRTPPGTADRTNLETPIQPEKREERSDDKTDVHSEPK